MARMNEWGTAIAQFMQINAPTVRQSDSIAHARLLMRTYDVRYLIVMDEQGPAGVVWERDLRAHSVMDKYIELATRGDKVNVEEVMRPRVPQVTAMTSAREVLRVLRAHPAGCVAVMDQDKLLGVVAASELIRRLMDQPAGAGSSGAASGGDA